MTTRISLRGLSLLAAAFTIHNSSAVSFRLPNQDPEGIARGNAFAATADNPSAIYYNPAGITQLEGHQLSLGVYAVSADTKYTALDGTGATANTDAALQPVPQIYFVCSPKGSSLSYGFGIYAPYGLALDWGRNTPFRFAAERGKVLYMCLNPVIAWQPCEKFSIGGGPTINYSYATLHTSSGAPLVPIPGLDQFKFNGEGMAYGFNIGMMFKPCEKISIGANYRYGTDVEYDGHTQFAPTFPKAATKGTLNFPQFIAGGISYRPTENWNIEADIDWTDWDAVNSVNFKGATFPVSIPFNHTSACMYEFGVTRQLPNNYHVSFGYIFSENSVPDATFNPIIPDADLHLGSIGFGHKGEKIDWTIAYHFATNGGGRVVPGPAAFGGGKYETFNQAVNASVVFKF
jgi:long-chain fatty acid transport protein